MCSSTTAERQSLASRDRTCCLRRCLPARPLRFYGFRGSMAHPTQSLCTLRTRRRRRPRNTRYRAPATAYPDRSLTGRTTPAFLAHKQSIDPPPSLRAKRSNPFFLYAAKMDCFASLAITSKHTFAISRRDAPEVLCLSLALRGRGERRMPVAPAASCALCIGRTHTSNNEYTGITRRSRTQWF